MSTADNFGRTTGLTKGQFVVRLFSEQHRKKRTDRELARLIREEFPASAGVNYEGLISFYMNQFNRGEIACQAGNAPAKVAFRYDEKGNAFHRIRGPKAKHERSTP